MRIALMLLAVVVMVGESARGEWGYMPLEEVVERASWIVEGKVESVSRDSAVLHVNSILKNGVGQKVEPGGTVTLDQPAQRGVSIDLPRHKLGMEGVWMLTATQNALVTTGPFSIQPLSSKERIAEIIARLERERSAVLESVLREEDQRDAERARLPLYDAARFEADLRSGPRPATDADRWHAMYVSEQRSRTGWVFVDTSGTVALATRYRAVLGDFVGGLVPVGVETRKGSTSSYGFMKASGEIAFSGYESAAPFSEGLAAVSQKGRYGYVDSAGKIAIPLKYDSAGLFAGGVAEVRQGEQRFLIDRDGKAHVGRTAAELDPKKLKFRVLRAEPFHDGNRHEKRGQARTKDRHRKSGHPTERLIGAARLRRYHCRDVGSGRLSSDSVVTSGWFEFAANCPGTGAWSGDGAAGAGERHSAGLSPESPAGGAGAGTIHRHHG